MTIRKGDNFLRRVRENYGIEKITGKLEEFYLYVFKGFVDELSKQKVKLSLNQQVRFLVLQNIGIFCVLTKISVEIDEIIGIISYIHEDGKHHIVNNHKKSNWKKGGFIQWH